MTNPGVTRSTRSWHNAGVIPVVTPDEMAAVDAASPVPVEQLIERAGRAVARAAVRLLGGTYGRRVVVVAGPGNNGNDGRIAARMLGARGVVVTVIDPTATSVPPCDLVIDAAFGTGFRGSYRSPAAPGSTVLAVDIVSGIDGNTGVASGRPATATATVTFAALKPGLLYGDGAVVSGRLDVADIGLDTSGSRTHLVEADDVAEWIVRRPVDAHKWKSALWIIGGTAEMAGAPVLASRGAFAGGAGYVRLSSPGAGALRSAPIEAVSVPLPMVGWDARVVAGGDRVAAVVVGPGLGRDDAVRDGVTGLATSSRLPMVIDGDGLWAIASLRGRMSDAPRILTPHDGEYTQLTGHPPGADRIAAARRLAAERSAIVVLKGPTTTVADPSGRVRVVVAGDNRLATAGTGDVLSGVIGAFLATGCDPFDAAAAAAQVHGMAALRCPVVGTTASHLPDAISAVLSDLVATGAAPRTIGRS